MPMTRTGAQSTRRACSAQNDHLYKFAISRAVRPSAGPEAKPIGVVAATITTTSTLAHSTSTTSGEP